MHLSEQPVLPVVKFPMKQAVPSSAAVVVQRVTWWLYASIIKHTEALSLVSNFKMNFKMKGEIFNYCMITSTGDTPAVQTV